jgi:hypothetical protein
MTEKMPGLTGQDRIRAAYWTLNAALFLALFAFALRPAV